MQLSPPSGITFAKPAIFRSLRCHVIFLDSLSDIFNWFAEDFNQEGLVGGGGASGRKRNEIRLSC